MFINSCFYSSLVNLRSLQSRDNLLKSIPDSLCNLQKLESLDLGSNEIEEIPHLVGKLISLKVLWLDLNQLKHLPPEIGRLKKLQYLEVSENMLETLPDEIGGCTGLTDINLAQNSIEFLPSTIGQLSNLNILRLEQNQLVVLTPNIGQCSQLAELTLTENLLSEVPESIGQLKLLSNFNVDRNRLARLPDGICNCESLTILFARDNQLTHLPERIGQLINLKVLDVAGNRLAHLPISLSQVTGLGAIWLAENQATGKIKLQPEFDEESQREVLTCYLLPQQNFSTPSMENLLQGSVGTHVESQQQQAQQSKEQEAEESNQPPNTSESVRFAPDPEQVDDKPSHFVRTNTPHPKELVKKKEAMKQRAANKSVNSNGSVGTPVAASAAGANADTVSETSEAVSHSSQAIPSQRREVNVNNNTSGVSFKEPERNEDDSNEQQQHYVQKHVDFKISARPIIMGEDEEDIEEDENEEENEDCQENESDGEGQNEEDQDESHQSGGVSQFRLRRRDTPHHLKGARINSPNNKAQQLDPNEIKDILERYSSSGANSPTGHPPTNSILNASPQAPSAGKVSFNAPVPAARTTVSINPVLNNSNTSNTSTLSKVKAKPAIQFIPENFQYDEMRKYIQLVINVNRSSGENAAGGLGIRIAGGKGSNNPYKEDDEGVYITRISPESPARLTGLKCGDKLLRVNQTSLNEMTHQQAADVLKEAVKQNGPQQLMLQVLQELDLNKLFFLPIPAMKQSADPQQPFDSDSTNSHSTAGFRINYNFNTHQQREVEIIFIADHKRFGLLQQGDILLQINGKNIDSMSEKELNKYIVNSSNPRCPPDVQITYLTVYRPYVEELVEQQQNGTLSLNENDDQPAITNNNGIHNGNGVVEHQGQNGYSNGSSAPLRSQNGTSHTEEESVVESAQLGNDEDDEDDIETADEYIKSCPYEIEEIRINKSNGAMGLSIVGGGNVPCHPFGMDKPGIFISKIVKEGPASRTGLRVGDRLLKVNGIDVTHMSHDECVDELKRNAAQVTLLVSHDPQPNGMQEITLQKAFADETIGIRINGGIENKSANIYDPADEGIFVVNVINGTLAHRDGRLKVGTRIMEVS